MQRAFLCLFLAFLFLLAGCQRVRVEKTITLDPGKIVQDPIVEGPRSQQKIRVEVKSEQPIDFGIALQSKAGGIVELLQVDKKPAESDYLAFKQKTTGDTLEATIPAGQSYCVILSGALKKTEVTVKLNSL